jgi:hypothetical protein
VTPNIRVSFAVSRAALGRGVRRQRAELMPRLDELAAVAVRCRGLRRVPTFNIRVSFVVSRSASGRSAGRQRAGRTRRLDEAAEACVCSCGALRVWCGRGRLASEGIDGGAVSLLVSDASRGFLHAGYVTACRHQKGRRTPQRGDARPLLESVPSPHPPNDARVLPHDLNGSCEPRAAAYAWHTGPPRSCSSA